MLCTALCGALHSWGNLSAGIRRLHCGDHWKAGIVVRLDVHRKAVRATVEHESYGVRREIQLRRLVQRPRLESGRAGLPGILPVFLSPWGSGWRLPAHDAARGQKSLLEVARTRAELGGVRARAARAHGRIGRPGRSESAFAPRRF